VLTAALQTWECAPNGGSGIGRTSKAITERVRY
jgi:hypothetical protein